MTDAGDPAAEQVPDDQEWPTHCQYCGTRLVSATLDFDKTNADRPELRPGEILRGWHAIARLGALRIGDPARERADVVVQGRGGERAARADVREIRPVGAARGRSPHGVALVAAGGAESLLARALLCIGGPPRCRRLPLEPGTIVGRVLGDDHQAHQPVRSAAVLRALAAIHAGPVGLP